MERLLLAKILSGLTKTNVEETFIKAMMELGTTGAFLVYLYIRNGRQEKSMKEVSEALGRNTRVLIKVAQKHGLIDEADELIEE